LANRQAKLVSDSSVCLKVFLKSQADLRTKPRGTPAIPTLLRLRPSLRRLPAVANPIDRR
jgi:hypothetical protein